MITVPLTLTPTLHKHSKHGNESYDCLKNVRNYFLSHTLYFLLCFKRLHFVSWFYCCFLMCGQCKSNRHIYSTSLETLPGLSPAIPYLSMVHCWHGGQCILLNRDNELTWGFNQKLNIQYLESSSDNASNRKISHLVYRVFIKENLEALLVTSVFQCYSIWW